MDPPGELLMDGPCLLVIYDKSPVPPSDDDVVAVDPRVCDRVHIDKADRTLWVSARRYGEDVTRPHGYDRLTQRANWVMAERDDRYLIIMRIGD
jgi:hypothetical protein